MKRGILLCLLALLLLLTACGGEKSPNVYEQNGYTVDLENRTGKVLKEFLGHTPLEVLCGAALGILIAVLMPAF